MEGNKCEPYTQFYYNDGYILLVIDEVYMR